MLRPETRVRLVQPVVNVEVSWLEPNQDLPEVDRRQKMVPIDFFESRRNLRYPLASI